MNKKEMTSSNTINCVVSEKESCTRKPLFINHFGQGHERFIERFASGHVSQDAVKRYILEQQGKDVFEYSIFGDSQTSIGDFTKC